jgi:small multidrug resistance pump
MSFVFLAIAIVSEVVATTALKSSAGFTRPGPAVLVVLGYGSAFYFLALCLRELKTGIVYAIWSGVGIVLITLLATVLHKERIDPAGWIGIAVIILGIVILNVFSDARIH